jgi:hypothetical protein
MNLTQIILLFLWTKQLLSCTVLVVNHFFIIQMKFFHSSISYKLYLIYMLIDISHIIHTVNYCTVCFQNGTCQYCITMQMYLIIILESHATGILFKFRKLTTDNFDYLILFIYPWIICLFFFILFINLIIITLSSHPFIIMDNLYVCLFFCLWILSHW